jgi:hypothetical protein
VIRRTKAPYSSTPVPVEQSRAQIDKLLRSYGIEDLQWTELWSKQIIKLRFALELEPPTEKTPGRSLHIEVSPPPFTAKRRNWNAKLGRAVVTEEPNWAQSYRCLWHWLKAKLEAIAFGLNSAEEEFLSSVIVQDSRGVEHRVFDLVKNGVAGGQLMLDAPKERPEVIDAELVR